MRSSVLLILLAAFCLAPQARAQMIPVDQTDIYWRLHDLAIIKDGCCTLQNKTTGKSKSFNLPSGYRNVHITDEGFWANVTSGAGTTKDQEVHFSADGIHWSLRGRWPVRGTAPYCRIFALKNRYLAIASGSAFKRGDTYSNFAVMAQKKGSNLEIESLLPMGTGKSFPGWLFVPPVIQIEDGWAVVNFRTGHIWLVNEAESGQVRIRNLKLFNSVKDQALEELGSIDPPILGCQSNSDGFLVIASRTEDAVNHAGALRKKLLKSNPMPSMTEDLEGIEPSQIGNPGVEARLQAAGKKAHQHQKNLEGPILKQYPDVQWWELNPKTGKITETSVPDGAPSKLLSPEMYQKFGFHFDFKGRIVISQ